MILKNAVIVLDVNQRIYVNDFLHMENCYIHKSCGKYITHDVQRFVHNLENCSVI